MATMDGYWQCGQCGMIFTDPEDGVLGSESCHCSILQLHFLEDVLREKRYNGTSTLDIVLSLDILFYYSVSLLCQYVVIYIV